MGERAEAHWTLHINPVPCPRPRITKKGWAYYPPKYKAWRNDAEDLLIEMRDSFDWKHPLPLSIKLEVNAVFVCRRPKTTKLSHPKPDIDNYLKALLDAGNAVIWEDDHLVTTVRASKQWATPGEEGYIEILITEAQ
jgi:Holliday junction resolvase RusA-like endonuclease